MVMIVPWRGRSWNCTRDFVCSQGESRTFWRLRPPLMFYLKKVMSLDDSSASEANEHSDLPETALKENVCVCMCVQDKYQVFVTNVPCVQHLITWQTSSLYSNYCSWETFVCSMAEIRAVQFQVCPVTMSFPSFGIVSTTSFVIVTESVKVLRSVRP
jgi:hypothetical protein